MSRKNRFSSNATTAYSNNGIRDIIVHADYVQNVPVLLFLSQLPRLMFLFNFEWQGFEAIHGSSGPRTKVTHCYIE
jgi:hypothetical protein